MKRVLVLIALAVTSVLAADAAQLTGFVGTWMLNQQKSKLTGDTFVYKNAAEGMLHFSGGGVEYKFKADGKEYKDSLGYTIVWKEAGERAWDVETKLPGKSIFTTHTELSADGRTMTMVSKGTKPNGDPFESKAKAERITGKEGLVGTWQSKNLELSSPSAMIIAADGADGLAFSYPDFQLSFKVKLDGKDYPVAGPTVPPGAAASARKTGGRTIEMEFKKDGKAFSHDRMELSADGRTLTDSATVPGSKDKPTVAVYDKQ